MSDAFRRPVPKALQPLIDLPLHKPTGTDDPARDLGEAISRLAATRPPIVPPDALGRPEAPNVVPAGTLIALLHDIASAAAPLSELVKLASEQSALSPSQKPNPMADGSPAYTSPTLLGNGADVVGLVATLLANEDAITSIAEKLSSLAGYGPDNLPPDTVTADDLGTLPLTELAGVIDTAARIAGPWATGSSDTSPRQFAAALHQASDSLRRTADGDPRI